jgi:hypothetical protein
MDQGTPMNDTFNHPYPDHVVESIQDQMQETYGVRNIPVGVEEVLEWLWQAQRIDTLEQLQEQVPEFSTIIDNEGHPFKAYEVYNPKIFPVRVVYWKEDVWENLK